MAGHEIHKAVKMARKFALENNYEAAVEYYAGLDKEIAAHQQSPACDADAGLAQLWEDLRGRLRAERSSVEELLQEWRAMTSAPEAVRRDRGGAPSSGPTTPTDAAPPPTAAPLRRAPAPAPDFGAGVGDAPSLGPPPSSSHARVAALNEQRYGDKDRFGPPLAGAAPPSGGGGGGVGFGLGGGGRAERSPASNKAAPPPAWGAGPPERGPPSAAAGAGAAPAKAAPQRTSSPVAGHGQHGARDAARGAAKDRKPPIPRFGGGGGGGNSNGNINGVHGKDGKDDGKGSTLPPFQPRAGEEELVALIESERTPRNGQPVKWDEIAGQREAKSVLEEAAVLPVLMPDFFRGLRRPWRGVLMYGPPGTGKTMLAKAVATESNTTFFNISTATLTSKWRGDSEKLVRVLFEMARYYAPSTIFIDEIDALCSSRGSEGEHEASRRVKSCVLTQMDGLGVDHSKVVMVLGATNHPWDIDEAMRRRLEKRIYIPLPTFEDRIELLQKCTKDITVGPDVNFEKLSRMLDGHYYSGADLTSIGRDAAMMTMRRFRQMHGQMNISELRAKGLDLGKQIAQLPVTMEDFEAAIKNTPSSVNAEGIKRFEAWKAEFEVL